MSHSWENVCRHSWEATEAADSDTDAEVDPLTNRNAAAEMFVNFMSDMYLSGSMSAHHFCVACFWAGKAGMPGNVQQFGLRPGSSSGHYQRHLDRVLGFRNLRKKLYQVHTVGHRKHDHSRSKFSVLVRPLHEALHDEITNDPTVSVLLREAIERGSLPPTYFSNPIVQQNEGPVVPLALYADSVPYSLTDSVIGVWLINLLTQRRHIVAVVRKRLLCKCGCKGWDTTFPIFLTSTTACSNSLQGRSRLHATMATSGPNATQIGSLWGGHP